MRRLWILFFTFAAALSFGITDSTLADQKDGMDKMKAEAMAKWQAYATPGDGHKIMGQLEGNWDYSLKYWTSPNTPPEESTGTNDVKWILGNRFLEMNVQGTSMGQPFEGMGLLGYDNTKKEYTSTWIDTMGTGMMSATGSYDPGTKSITEVGNFTDPMLGEQSFKGITKFVDTDNITYEMFISTPTGEEFRVMEINYTRKK